MAHTIGFTDVLYTGSCGDYLEWWLHLKTVGERWELTSENALRKLPNSQEFSWQKTALNVVLMFSYILLAPLTLLALLIRHCERTSVLAHIEEEKGPTTQKLCFEPHFLTKKEAQQAMRELGALHSALTDYDRLVRVGKETSTEEFKEYCAEQALEWGEEEKEAIVADLEKINAKLQTLNVVWPQRLTFIKTTGKEELLGTTAYCCEGTMVFCGHYHPQWLAHEIFHILSQFNFEKKVALYQKLGFHETDHPFVFPEKAVTNPDYLDNRYAITIEHEGVEVTGVPVDLIQDPTKRFLSALQCRLLLEDGTLISFQNNPTFLAKVGVNTGYTNSPEEILAENFAAWIKGQSVPTPSVLEEMREILQS